MAELERELLAFPKGAHDDIIDALSMHIGFWVDEVEMRSREKTVSHKADPFSGQAVLDELRGRSLALNRYPADIGLMRERYQNNNYREYSCA